jgi:hypothetical protein
MAPTPGELKDALDTAVHENRLLKVALHREQARATALERRLAASETAHHAFVKAVVSSSGPRRES